MKKLYLIRHAKSSWDDPTLDDFDRPLNNRGLKDAPRMGLRLVQKDVKPQIVMSSPALRALHTCQLMCEPLAFDKAKIILLPQLYHASANQLLEQTQKIDPISETEPESVLIFGHNPGLTDFVNRLLNEQIINIPTAGIVGAVLNIKKWHEVDWGCGKLTFLDFPKNIR